MMNEQLPVFDDSETGNNTDYDSQTLTDFDFSLIDDSGSTFDDEQMDGVTEGNSDDAVELTEEDIAEITLPGSGNTTTPPGDTSSGGTGTDTEKKTEKPSDPLKNLRTSDAKVFSSIEPTKVIIRPQKIGELQRLKTGNRSAGNESRRHRYTGQLNESMFKSSNVLDSILLCNPIQVGIVNKSVPFTWNRHEEIHFVVDNVYPVISGDLTGTLDKNWGETYFCAIGLTFAFRMAGITQFASTSAWEMSRGAEILVKGIDDYPTGRPSERVYQKLNQVKSWKGAILSRVKVETQVGENKSTTVKSAGHVMLVIGVKTDVRGNVIAFYTAEYNAGLGAISDPLGELNTGTDGSRDGGLVAFNIVTVASLCGLSRGTEQFPLRNTAWRLKNLSGLPGGEYCPDGLLSGPKTQLVDDVLSRMTSGDPDIVQRQGITSLLQVCKS